MNLLCFFFLAKICFRLFFLCHYPALFSPSTHTHTRTNTNTLTFTHPHTHIHTLTHTHTNTNTHTNTCSNTITHTNTLSHTHPNKLTRTKYNGRRRTFAELYGTHPNSRFNLVNEHEQSQLQGQEEGKKTTTFPI